MFITDLLGTIDDRVRSLVRPDALRENVSPGATAWGTVSSRSTSYYDRTAQVMFDASGLAVPVRVAANVEVDPNDRVILQRFGSIWCVVGCFTKHWPANSSYNAVGTVGTTTSGSYADLPGSPTLTLVGSNQKRWDETKLRMTLTFSVWSTATGTQMQAGMQVVGPAGTTTNTLVQNFEFDVANTHETVSAYVDVAGYVAGEYTVKPQWARILGTGTVTINAGDTVSARVEEVGP